MNVVEKYIYDMVKAYPELKDNIVNLYRRIFSLIPGDPVMTDLTIIVRENYFFGFHDKSPWSADNTMLLAHNHTIGNKYPGQDDEVGIGYFIGEDWCNYVPVTTSRAWNWQTGSMLQWIGTSHSFIFNDFNGMKHISKKYNCVDQTTIEYPYPIAAVSHNGKYAVSHSFNRLRSRLGSTSYGYANGADSDENVKISLSESLKLIDLAAGSIKPLIRLKDIVLYAPNKSMDNAYHYFTHCLFSPQNDRIAFFHRWINSARQEFTRMFTCNIDGSDLFLFKMNNMVSHIAWEDNSTILAYGDIDGIEQYYLLKDKTEKNEYLNVNVFNENGHPSYSTKGLIITDTYPDRKGYLSLMLYDKEKKLLNVLAKLRTPYSFRGGIKCDLHPRWDRTSQFICFDSAHTGIRALCTMRVLNDS
ncbi:MAG: hypothetical protein ACE5D0_00975 [Fidelibacterota bacterium]